MSDLQQRLSAALRDRYRIDREIGTGGMAVVYLADDLKHGRRVALKVLRPQLADDLGADRFLREIRIAAGLSHANIIPLFDSGEADGLLYFVMPFVEGETLRQRLRREGTLALDEVVRITAEVADALASAHKAGVVHRDIKPENILLEDGHARVADFGVARAMDAAGGDRLTSTSVRIGTLSYMSPEQASAEPIDRRSDIYSLGCTAYEMLAGQPPFTGATEREVLAGHLALEPPPLRASRPEVPPGVEAAIERALEKKPADRFDTASDLAHALETGVTAEAIAADKRRKRRNRAIRSVLWIVAAAATALIAVRIYPMIAGPRYSRVAVLPAVNRTTDPDLDYFADDVSSGLVRELRRAGIDVTGRQSVRQYRNSDSPARQIALELGVEALIEPTLMQMGDSVTVGVSATDGRTDLIVWDSVFTSEAAAVVGLYREISHAIAVAFEVDLDEEAERQLAERPIVNTQAYDAVARGRFHQAQFTPQDFSAAQTWFESALQADPDFAPAYVGLASNTLARASASLIPVPEGKRLVEQYLDRAFELDPGNPEALATRAMKTFLIDWDWPAAEAAYRTAIDADPNDAGPHVLYSHLLAILGRWEESDEHARRAMALDSLTPTIIGLYATQVELAGRHQEAIDIMNRMFARYPAARFGQAANQAALFGAGREQEAFDLRMRRFTERGDTAAAAAMRAGFAEGGFSSGYRQVARLLSMRPTSQRAGAQTVAELYAYAGDAEAAIDWLGVAVEQNGQNVPYMGTVQAYQFLHNDPRFIELLDRLNLPAGTPPGPAAPR